MLPGRRLGSARPLRRQNALSLGGSLRVHAGLRGAREGGRSLRCAV